MTYNNQLTEKKKTGVGGWFHQRKGPTYRSKVGTMPRSDKAAREAEVKAVVVQEGHREEGY
jgi:hypothetical protein